MVTLPPSPNFRLHGKRALVTGAGRGIGLAAAAALADAGAHVVLAARTRGEIDGAAEAIRAKGGSAEALPLDVTDLDAVQRAVRVQAPFHILFNNAGGNRPQPFLDFKIEDFDFIMGLNVRAAFVMAQAVARRMIEAKIAGSLIHTTSQMAFTTGPGRTAYCASKAAVEAFSRGIALELAPHGIRSNTLAPTFIETPMSRPFLEDKALKDFVMTKIKLGRIGQVEDLTGAIVYLASDASSLMTGTHMLIDGGWTLG